MRKIHWYPGSTSTLLLQHIQQFNLHIKYFGNSIRILAHSPALRPRVFREILQCSFHSILCFHGTPQENTHIYILTRLMIQYMEKAMAPHSSTLAWKIPWMEEPGGLQSMGSQRVGHDWATSLSLFTFHALEKEMATHSSVLAWRIPGTAEPGGLPSMGSHRVGHDWSDLAAVAAWYNINLTLSKDKQQTNINQHIQSVYNYSS